MASKNAKANGSAAKKTESKTSKKARMIHLAMVGSKKGACGARGKTGSDQAATCPECKRIADHAAAMLRDGAEAPADTRPGTPATAANEGGATNCATQPGTKPRKGARAATKSSAGQDKERDPRIPPVGTVITKLDRHGEVRCQCKVVDGGFEYKGEIFKSLSGAAAAAAKDLGVSASVNGWLFWNLIKPEPRANKNPVQALEKAWDRYSARLKALAGNDLDAGTKQQVAQLLEDQGKKIAEASGSFEQSE